MNKAHAVHIMRAYRTLLPQHNNVADGQAVPGKILRMGSIEFHVQVIQAGFCNAVRREHPGIDRLVMVKCRLKAMLPEILRIHKAKLCHFRISAELIDAVAVCRILLERFLPSVFRDDGKLLLYRLPVCAVNTEDAVVVQNLRLFKSHRLGIVPIEKIYRHIPFKQLHGTLFCQREHRIIRIAVGVSCLHGNCRVRRNIRLWLRVLLHRRLNGNRRILSGLQFIQYSDVRNLKRGVLPDSMGVADFHRRLGQSTDFLIQLTAVDFLHGCLIVNRVIHTSVRALNMKIPVIHGIKALHRHGRFSGNQLRLALFQDFRIVPVDIVDKTVGGLADYLQTFPKLRQGFIL